MLVTPDFQSPDDCFQVRDMYDDYMKASLCIWRANLKNKDMLTELQGWISSIDEFKHKCRFPRPVIYFPDKKGEKEKEMLDIMEMKEFSENSKDKFELDKYKEIALQRVRKAIAMYEREKKYEEKAILEERLLEKQQFSKLQDEKQKQAQQELMMDHEMVKTKPKPKLFASTPAEMLEQKYMDAVRASRLRLIVQLNAMRRSAIRRKHEKIKEMALMKAKVASQMIQENRQGEADHCKLDQSMESRVKWCEGQGENKLERCTKKAESPSEFCIFCCEQEFGALYFVERKNCFSCCSDTHVEKVGLLPGLGPIPVECLNLEDGELSKPCVKALMRENKGFDLAAEQSKYKEFMEKNLS